MMASSASRISTGSTARSAHRFYSIMPDDPLSAEARIHWHKEYGRDDFRIPLDARTHMRAARPSSCSTASSTPMRARRASSRGSGAAASRATTSRRPASEGAVDVQTTWIDDCHVYDVHAATFRRGALKVEGNRIAEIAERAPRDANRVDMGGAYVMPGFFDCHVHICMRTEAADANDVWHGALPGTIAIYAAEAAKKMLRAGITTARDVGGWDYHEIAVREAINSGLIEGPRLHCAGRLLSITSSTTPVLSRHVRGGRRARRGAARGAKTAFDGRRPDQDARHRRADLDEIRARRRDPVSARRDQRRGRDRRGQLHLRRRARPCAGRASATRSRPAAARSSTAVLATRRCSA